MIVSLQASVLKGKRQSGKVVYLRENSRLLKCWGFPCLRRDIVVLVARAGAHGALSLGSHREAPGEQGRRLQRKYLHQCLLTSKIN